MGDLATGVVALMSDIHANVEALRAVLRELENELLDDIVVAGDVVVRCLHDAECIDMLRDLSCVVIAGNADLRVVTGEFAATAKIKDDIGPERTAFLAALPREHPVEVVRSMETEPSILGLSIHIMAVAKK